MMVLVSAMIVMSRLDRFIMLAVIWNGALDVVINSLVVHVNMIKKDWNRYRFRFILARLHVHRLHVEPFSFGPSF